jgi:hypothetical protein
MKAKKKNVKSIAWVKKLLVIEEVEKETKQKKTLQLNLVYHPVSNNKKNKINNKYFIIRLEKKG